MLSNGTSGDLLFNYRGSLNRKDLLVIACFICYWMQPILKIVLVSPWRIGSQHIGLVNFVVPSSSPLSSWNSQQGILAGMSCSLMKDVLRDLRLNTFWRLWVWWCWDSSWWAVWMRLYILVIFLINLVLGEIDLIGRCFLVDLGLGCLLSILLLRRKACLLSIFLGLECCIGRVLLTYDVVAACARALGSCRDQAKWGPWLLIRWSLKIHVFSSLGLHILLFFTWFNIDWWRGTWSELNKTICAH
jgi:hypothetical protein